jgi:hypothetical protein
MQSRRWVQELFSYLCVQLTMEQVEQLDLSTIERLRKQEALLERVYRADYAVDPGSQATEMSRSNLIALRHTFRQLYGKAG